MVKKLARNDSSIKRKMLSIIILILVSVTAFLGVVFWQTNITLKNRGIESLYYSAKEISGQIDDTISNIYNVSDTFANESRLTQFLDQAYGDERRLEKRQTINITIRRLLDGYDLLQNNEQISAIYTYHNELFNFSDPNCDSQEVIDTLLAMGIESSEKLARFYWYPLQKNFLKLDAYNEVRKDQVIIGSRRVYSKLKGNYPYIHIFVLKEESLYEKYENIAEQSGGTVYILGEDGGLLSSSNEQVVISGQVPKQIGQIIQDPTLDNVELKMDGQHYFVSVYRSPLNGWLSIISVPSSTITGPMQQLYFKLAWLLGICIIMCVFLVLYLYRSFMTPISQLNQSMKSVFDGDMDAYVEVKGSAETRNMMLYYNTMLESINVNVKEKYEMQKTKKEMELEVLMSQVNPHFLYNTLETIVWKAGEANSPEIGRIAAALGRFYRLSISGGNLLVRFSQELEQVSSYIRIQKSRYGEQFHFDLRADYDALRGYYTLKLVLQPVVENSFIYAMTGLQRALTIRLTVYVKDTYIKVVVIDNGSGMSAEKLQQVREQITHGKKQSSDDGQRERKSTGIGLYGVRARLNLYFGIQNGIDIYSKEGKGTMVVIRIPKLESDKLEE